MLYQHIFTKKTIRENKCQAIYCGGNWKANNYYGTRNNLEKITSSDKLCTR